MAVYTHLTAAEIAEFVAAYDVGELVSAKGIAEGVSNSNWIVETSAARFILTVYEERTEICELPFFLDLLDHLAAKGCPVPRTIHDRDGASYRLVRGDKPAALIEFLPGVSVDEPTPEQARNTGAALAGMHLSVADFPARRANSLGLDAWVQLLEECGDGLGGIAPELAEYVALELAFLRLHWPTGLPQSIVHADLFPDNVLLRGDTVSAMIDFYFACHDITAFDLATTHAAWCFKAGGREFRPDISAALIDGYRSVRELEDDEMAALPILARGAAMRFVATRAYDWINTPADALVTRKDPLDFMRRGQFYAAQGAAVFA